MEWASEVWEAAASEGEELAVEGWKAGGGEGGKRSWRRRWWWRCGRGWNVA